MKDLISKNVSEIRDLLQKKTVSAREIYNAHLDHIRQYNPDIQAFLCLTEELGLEQADHLDQLVKGGEELPSLAGVTVSLKDNLCLPNYPTTCASKILANFIPNYHATAVANLFNAGALCLGKTNLDEFAMGSSTENSASFPTRNPWHLKRVPGGSSGGSAAAVAAGFSTIALGSDTGGSVRQPASCCGIVGMKPTYGLVSRFGLIAFASSLDQIGPLTRTVEDTAVTLAVIAGHDHRDSTSFPDSHFPTPAEAIAQLKQFTQEDGMSSAKIRIGLIKELMSTSNEPEVSTAITNACRILEKLGATVEEVSIPRAKNALPVYYIVAMAEASANLARYDGVRYGSRDLSHKDVTTMYKATRQAGFGAEVKRRIMLGTYVLSSGYYEAYYHQAQAVRKLLFEDFKKVFERYDMVISPTSPTVAFEFGAKTDDPIQMYLSDIASVPANLAGLPGVSIPCGFGKDNMPIGLQFIGAPLSDLKLLQVAHAFEQSTDFHLKQSEILGGFHNNKI